MKRTRLVESTGSGCGDPSRVILGSDPTLGEHVGSDLVKNSGSDAG